MSYVNLLSFYFLFLGGKSKEAISRLLLLDRSAYEDDLDELLKLIAGANLSAPSRKLIAEYREERRLRENDMNGQTVDNQSTIASKGAYDMSNFDITSLHSAHKFSVKVVQIDLGKLKRFLAARLFGGRLDELELCLIELVAILNLLRSHFVYLNEKKFGYTEPGYFQPIYTLFLERLSSRIGRSPHNKTGAALPLEFDADVQLDGGDIESVSISGKTDIVKMNFEEDDTYDGVEFFVELKPPFSSLYHATSDGPKGQLLCELRGLFNMSSEERRTVGGGLSDLFAIILCFGYSVSKPEYLMTKSVVDSDEYICHLMLLFCYSDDGNGDLFTEQFELPALPIEDKNPTDPNLGAGGGGGRVLRSSSRAGASARSALNRRTNNSSTSQPAPAKDKKVLSAKEFEVSARKGVGVHCALSRRSGNRSAPTPAPIQVKKVLPAAEELEESFKAESELQKWYARHNKLIMLCSENVSLSQHNQWSCGV